MGKGLIQRLALTATILLQSRAAAADEVSSAPSLTAAASQQTVPAPRDGTLGIPSVAGAGVIALADSAFNFGQGQYNLTFFAQVGRLQLGRNISLDVMAETTSIDAPISTYDPSATPVVRPLPGLQQLALDSVGFRIRFGLSSQSANDTQFKKKVSTCLSERHDAIRDDDCQKNFGIPAVENPANLDDIAAWTAALQKHLAGWSLIAGARILYRQASGGGAPTGGTGGALELALQGLDTWGGGFLSASGLSAGGNSSTTGNTRVREELVRELQFAGGLYWQFNVPTGSTQLLPTLGVYATYTRNFWENPFFAPTADRFISGDRVELVGYASGHFSGGFAGLLSVSLIKPFGPDYSTWQTIFSVAPILGASTSQ